MEIDTLNITYEELEDYNSRPVPKMFGIAMTPIEATIAEKVNELIEHHNNHHDDK